MGCRLTFCASKKNKMKRNARKTRKNEKKTQARVASVKAGRDTDQPKFWSL